MRIAAALMLVLPAVFAPPTFGQSFVGEWTATAVTPGGSEPETLTATKTGESYAIKAKLVGVPEGTPEAGPGTDIVLDGDKFSYKRTINTPDGSLVITYTGAVSGDTF